MIATHRARFGMPVASSPWFQIDQQQVVGATGSLSGTGIGVHHGVGYDTGGLTR